jgi:PAS domain S-box-containing protein
MLIDPGGLRTLIPGSPALNYEQVLSFERRIRRQVGVPMLEWASDLFGGPIDRVGEDSSGREAKSVYDDVVKFARNRGLPMTTVGDRLADDPWLAAIVESSDDAIIVEDVGGIALSWNKSAERLFGYSAAEIIGQPIISTFQPDRVAEENLLLDRIVRGESVDHYETNRCHKNGQVIKVSVTISCIKDASRMIVGSSTILRDLTDRNIRDQRIRDLEAALVHVERLIEAGHAVSTLVHEANESLTAIGNYASACRRLAISAGQERISTGLGCVLDQTIRSSTIVKRIRECVQGDDREA